MLKDSQPVAVIPEGGNTATTSPITLSSNGTAYVTIPNYSPGVYSVKETIPATLSAYEYYGATKEKDGTLPVTLTMGKNTTVNFQNTYNASLTLTKKVKIPDGSGLSTDDKFTFQLFQKVGDSFNPVMQNGSPVTAELGNNGSAVVYVPAGPEYYWAELTAGGKAYSLSNYYIDGTVPTTMVDGNIVPLVAVGEIGTTGTASTTVTNVMRVLTIEKRDADTNQIINQSSAARFAVYPVVDNVRSDTAFASDVKLISGKASMKIPAGTYHVVEVTPPAEYEEYVNSKVPAVGGKQNYQILTVPEKADETAVFLDKKLGKLVINKSLDGDAGKNTVIGTVLNFKVYAYQSSGNPTPYPNEANQVKIPVKIDGEGKGTATQSLPHGKYVLKETTDSVKFEPRDGYIGANGAPFDKSNPNPIVIGDGTTTINVVNKVKQVTITVEKVEIVDGKEQPLKGAQIYLLGPGGGRTQTTTDSGVVSFVVPLYNGNDTTGKVTITEYRAPVGYQGSDEKFTIDLSQYVDKYYSGIEITEGINKAGETVPLKFVNQKVVTVTGSKVWQLEGDDSAPKPQKGVVMALYGLNGETGFYECVAAASTDEKGDVSFSSIPVGSIGTYYLVEAYSPFGKPQGGKSFAPPNVDGSKAYEAQMLEKTYWSNIPQADIGKYAAHKVTINGSTGTCASFVNVVAQKEITLQKTGGTPPYTGLTFKLTGGPEAKEYPVNLNGDSATLKLPEGIYTLTESGTGGGTTSAYFKGGVTFQVRSDGSILILDIPEATKKWVEAKGSTLTVTNPKLGGLIILKRVGSETGPGLKGVSFTVKYAESLEGSQPTSFPNTVTTPVTNEEGRIVLTDLVPGWYMVQEKDLPAGNQNYVKDPNPKYVQVGNGQADVTLTFVNQPYGFLTLHKMLADGSKGYPASGAFFTVAPADDATKKVYKDGTVNVQPGDSQKVPLPAGNYLITEKAVKNWYLKSVTSGGAPVTAEEKGYPITVASGKTPEMTFTNATAQGTIKVTKLGQGDTPLAGAEFTISAVGDNTSGITFEPAKLVTGSDGTATVTVTFPEALAQSGTSVKFILTETKVPEGYLPPDESAEKPSVELLPGGAKEVKVTNAKGAAITVTKHNNVKGQATGTIDGVAFELYRNGAEGWSMVDSGVTSGGTVTFQENLPTGEYALWEDESKLSGEYAGYALDSVWLGDAPKDSLSFDGKKLFTLGTLNAGESYAADAYNRPSQKLTITKYELDNHENTDVWATYDIYEAPEGASGWTAEEIKVLDLSTLTKVSSVTEKTQTVETRLQTGLYLVEETDSNLLLNADDERTPTRQLVEVPVGGTSLTFKNACKAEDVDIKLVKSAEKIPTELEAGGTETSLLDEGHTVKFTLSDLTPQSGITAPIKSYTLSDPTLTMYDNEAIDTNNVVEGVSYRIDGVHVGPATYGASKGAMVTLTATLASGGTKPYGPMDAAAGYDFTAEEEGWTGFTLLYTAQENDAFAGFTAGDVTFNAIIDQQVSPDNQPVKPVRRVYNRATATLEPIAGSSKNVTAEAHVTFPWDNSLPAMSLKKTQTLLNDLKEPGQDKLLINGYVEYTLKLTNNDPAKAVQKPVIIDHMASSLKLDTDSDGSFFKSEVIGGQVGVTMEQRDNNCILFQFDRALQPGETFTVSFVAKVLPEVLGNAENGEPAVAQNTAYATSLHRITPYENNSKGMSFTAANGGGNDQNLLYADGKDPFVRQLDDMLQKSGELGFGYLYSTVTQAASYAGSVILTKKVSTGRENADGGDKTFTEGETARTKTGDTITYHLTLYNLSDSPFTNIRIADALPRVGDKRFDQGSGRNSRWGPQFKSVSGAEAYDLGERPNSAMLIADIQKETSGYTKPASAETDYLYFDLGGTMLPAKESLTLTYQCTVPEGMPDEALYELANNDCAAVYRVVGSDESTSPIGVPAVSNVVSVVLEPNPVKVGGFLWIDTDGNNVASDDEKTHEDAKIAASGMSIQLYEIRNGASNLLAKYDGWQTQDSGPYQFVFDNLSPTAPKVGDENAVYNGKNLDTSKLRGQPPTTYQLKIEGIPAGYHLVIPYAGGDYWKSKKANSLINNNGSKISHFTQNGDSAISEEFFLWTEENGDDLFKNIGLARTHGFTVRKVDSDSNLPLPEAEFQIHGPFNSGATVTAEMVTKENLLATKRTDASGTLSFNGLSAYQQYVLVETKAPLNYTFENATADIGETLLVNGNPAWVIPVGQAVGGTVTVKNISAKASLTIQKVVEGGAVPDDVFSITLTYDGNPYAGEYQVGGQTLMTEDGVIQLRADETATVSGLTVGKSYRVTETAIPAGYALKAVANGDGSENWAIKPESNAVTVTNTNTMNGKVILNATKSLLNSDGSVRPLKADQFTFQVTGGSLAAPLTAKNDAVGNVTFPEIAFTGSDIGKTYTYTISEIAPEQNPSQGITYDTTTYTATVTVTAGGENGALLTAVAYSSGDTLPTFTNTYKAAGEITLGAFKRVEGGATQRDGQFTFLLKEDGTEYSQEAANKADGTVTFAPISYEEPGEHDYTITEKGGFEYGYKYSDASYRVHVSVTDNGDGTLAAKATMDDKKFDPKDALFVNRFAALSLDLYKHRYGNVSRPINGAEFTLYRYDENAASNRGVAVGSGATSGGGRLRFENLDEGRYVLVETYVPYRYSALKSQYEFNLSNDGNNNAVITLDSGELYASVHDHTLYVPNRYRSGGGGGDDSYRDDGSPEGGGGNPGTPFDPNPLTRIPDAAVPLAPAPAPLTTIPDEDVPLGGLPNTGGFPVGAFAIIGGLLALLGIKLKRNKRREDA